MSEILVSPAVIASLAAISVQAAHKALVRGAFGPPVRRGRFVYVSLAGLEQRLGMRFRPEQVETATARGYRRLVRVNLPEE